jgi:CDP-diacylglycerol---glycerol-3-phosphate 3-phosphatidyltransferase
LAPILTGPNIKETNIPNKPVENEKPVPKLAVFRKSIATVLTQRVVSILARTSVTPNTITWIGFFIIFAASILAALGYNIAAGLVVLFAGYFDIIDGALARRTNQVTRFGSVLDSTLDRLSEALVLIGLMVYYLFIAEPDRKWIIILLAVSMISSFLVSYVRARAEGIKINCEVGIFTRTERVIILALGLLVSQVLIAVSIITLLSVITVIQRLVFVYQQAKTT